MVNLPFEFDRNTEIGLAEQLADGFSRAICDGLYVSGDVLPTIKELSTELGVSEMTVRGALKRLVDARLVNPRRGIGSVVVGAQGTLKRGRVLLVTLSLSGNYCHTVMRAILQDELLRAGYLPIQVSIVPQADGTCDFTQLDQLLGESVCLSVVFGVWHDVWKHLEERGEKCVVLGNVGKLHVAQDIYSALPEFIADCRRQNLHRVLLPFVKTSPIAEGLARQMRASGLSARVWNMRIVSGDSSRERMFRTTFEAFCSRLDRGRDWLPEVLFFADDEMAAAALHALDKAGVRIPEDVGFVTWHACGSAPFYGKRLTCLETDPVADGRKFARCVLRVLSGRGLPKRFTLGSGYVTGETLVRRKM